MSSVNISSFKTSSYHIASCKKKDVLHIELCIHCSKNMVCKMPPAMLIMTLPTLG